MFRLCALFTVSLIFSLQSLAENTTKPNENDSDLYDNYIMYTQPGGLYYNSDEFTTDPYADTSPYYVDTTSPNYHSTNEQKNSNTHFSTITKKVNQVTTPLPTSIEPKKTTVRLVDY